MGKEIPFSLLKLHKQVFLNYLAGNTIKYVELPSIVKN